MWVFQNVTLNIKFITTKIPIKYFNIYAKYTGMPIKIGINGFGRIGRVILRTCVQESDLEVTAINDPAVDIDYICYLIKFDSTHGKFNGEVTYSNGEITINGDKIKIFHEKQPSSIPWRTAGVQYVVEASGMFTSLEKASEHLAGDDVRRVIVTAPSVDIPMVILGVNEDKITAEHKVISCASSTLYCLAPIVHVLQERYGVSEGFITSIHAMTPSLKPLDGLCLRGKHWRDHRSIHQNIIPASTGACKALSKIIPKVRDKMTGLAFRVPIVNVSVLDITIRLNSNTALDNIISNIEKESKAKMKDIIKVCKDEAVSSDFLGDKNSCILDVKSSLQLTQNFFKLICWYENEYSYACRVVDSIRFSEKQFSLVTASNAMFVRPVLFRKPRYSHPTMTIDKTKSIYCNVHAQNNARIFSSTSQETGLKTKIQKQIPMKKPLLRNAGLIPLAHYDNWNKGEVVKIWNDIEPIAKPSKPNHSSLVNSCVTIVPCSIGRDNYIKTQKRLEQVKMEFSKMVMMTEDLLRKSNHEASQLKDILNQKNTTEKNVILEQSKIQENAMGGDFVSEVSNHAFTKIDEICKSLGDNSNATLKDTMNTDINANQILTELTNETTTEQLLEYCKKFQKLPTYREDNNQPFELKQTHTIQHEVREDEGQLNTMYDYGDSCKNEDQTCNEHNNESSNMDNFRDDNRTIEADLKNDFSVMNVNVETNVKPNKSMLNQCETIVNTNDQEIVICNDDSKHYIPVNTGKEIKKKVIASIIKRLSVDTFQPNLEEPSYTRAGITDRLNNGKSIEQTQDIYDKLDSVSATDSENSFKMDEKKSQVINITDLTNSVEDLARLDKICKIIEISDELSDELFSSLETNNKELHTKKWSFKDLCERIKLDEFCNKVFGQSIG